MIATIEDEEPEDVEVFLCDEHGELLDERPAQFTAGEWQAIERIALARGLSIEALLQQMLERAAFSLS